MEILNEHASQICLGCHILATPHPILNHKGTKRIDLSTGTWAILYLCQSVLITMKLSFSPLLCFPGPLGWDDDVIKIITPSSVLQQLSWTHDPLAEIWLRESAIYNTIVDTSLTSVSLMHVPNRHGNQCSKRGEAYLWHKMKQLSNISLSVSQPAGIKPGPIDWQFSVVA